MKHVPLLAFALGSFFLISETHAQHSSNSKEEFKQDLVQAGSGFKCPFVFGTFPDPDDCKHFYICMAGSAFRKKCPKFLSFDILTRRCMPSLIATCGTDKDKSSTPVPDSKVTQTTTTTTTTTRITEGDSFVCTSFTGVFPDPKDCSKYYSCFFYRATAKTCPEKELFDAIKKSCQPEAQVHCGTRQRPVDLTTAEIPDITTDETAKETNVTPEKTDTPTAVTPEKTDTPTAVTPEITDTPTYVTPEITDTPTYVTPEITDTPTYVTPEITDTPTYVTPEITDATAEPTTRLTVTDFICNTSPYIKPTGPPEHDCKENDLDCIIDETGDANDWFKCPEDVGSYPHPSSDKLFIFCKNWIPSVKKCGQDLMFSKQLMTCIETFL